MSLCYMQPTLNSNTAGLNEPADMPYILSDRQLRRTALKINIPRKNMHPPFAVAHFLQRLLAPGQAWYNDVSQRPAEV